MATILTVTAPASATAGASFDVTVTAKDKYDNVATGYAGSVTFTSTDPNTTLWCCLPSIPSCPVTTVRTPLP